MLHRRKSLPSITFRPMGRGPLLGVGARRLERRRAGAGWRKAIVPLLLVAAAASWVVVIGPDLRGDTKTQKNRLKACKTKGSALNHKNVVVPMQHPAGPRQATAPQLAPTSLHAVGGSRNSQTRRGDGPINRALLGAARDHIARGVYAAWGSVPDLDAIKAADVDLIERGLHLAGFPLREAIVRHRFKALRRYGLRRRPQATPANRKRALTTSTLRVFLDRFAEQLPIHWRGAGGGVGSADADDPGYGDAIGIGDAAVMAAAPRIDSYRGGDIVLVQGRATGKSRRRRRRKMFAVVSDRTDERGVSLLITLDPREGLVRERHALSHYQVLRHYRLNDKEINDAYETLAMRRRHRAARRPAGRSDRGRLL